MGFAVVHLEKAKGSDSGMSAHIERTIAPKNADAERTHLNRELIEFPNGITNRTEAIQHRLESAGLTRKIANNQVRAIRVMLSGTHEDMIKIENDGKLDEWCSDNLNWLNKNFGKDNVVSAVLHLDEKTPHIHATVIPIVETERKRRKREEQVKKTYRKKKPAPRLCADEVMSRIALKGYQDSYANIMSKYGLQRGIDGSEAKHISTSQYYRELHQQSESLQENISTLIEQQAKAKKELSDVKSEVSKEKFKNTAADVGTKLLDGASSLLGTSKVKRLEAENQQLRAETAEARQETEQIRQELTEQYENYKKGINVEYNRRLKEFNEKEKQLKKEKSHLQSVIDRLFELFPKAKEMLRIEKLCRAIGFAGDLLKQLLGMEKIYFSGNIYSSEHRKKFKTEHSSAQIVPNHAEPHKLTLKIDDKEHTEWFREQQHRIMYPSHYQNSVNRGVKL